MSKPYFILIFVLAVLIAFFVMRALNDELMQENTPASTSSADALSGSSYALWPNFVKPADSELREMLTPLQYSVTQQDGTERAFDNVYHDFKGEGIYVDIVSGEPLFSSTDKFDSGTGWPSFTKPISPDAVTEHTDYKLVLPRTEIRSVHADSHLGHVFNDGPKETGGLRYCMNSAALRFVPKEELAGTPYQEYLSLFEGE